MKSTILILVILMLPLATATEFTGQISTNPDFDENEVSPEPLDTPAQTEDSGGGNSGGGGRNRRSNQDNNLDAVNPAVQAEIPQKETSADDNEGEDVSAREESLGREMITAGEAGPETDEPVSVGNKITGAAIGVLSESSWGYAVGLAIFVCVLAGAAIYFKRKRLK